MEGHILEILHSGLFSTVIMIRIEEIIRCTRVPHKLKIYQKQNNEI